MTEEFDPATPPPFEADPSLVDRCVDATARSRVARRNGLKRRPHSWVLTRLRRADRYGRRRAFDREKFLAAIRELADAGVDTYSLGPAIGECDRSLRGWIKGESEPGPTTDRYYTKPICPICGERQIRQSKATCANAECQYAHALGQLAEPEQLRGVPTAQIVARYARATASLMDETNDNGIRTRYVLAEYTEELAARLLNGHRCDIGTPDVDVAADGKRVSVKCATLRAGASTVHSSPIVFSQRDGWDAAVYVLFDRDNQIVGAWMFGPELVRDAMKWSERQKGWRVSMNKQLLDQCLDVTEDVKGLEAELRPAELDELRDLELALAKRDVLRTRHIIGELGEWYAARALGGELAGRCERGYDVKVPGLGRVQVKTCVWDPKRSPAQASTRLKPTDEGYDHAAVVYLNPEDYSVRELVLLNATDARTCGTRSGIAFGHVIGHPNALHVIYDGELVEGDWLSKARRLDNQARRSSIHSV